MQNPNMSDESSDSENSDSEDEEGEKLAFFFLLFGLKKSVFKFFDLLVIRHLCNSFDLLIIRP